jgi:hypothetical protein
MSLHIRRASLDGDRPELIELIRRNLTPLSDERRFAWLYSDCPHGAARAWLACDGASPVGLAGAFPRKMYFNGKERMAFVLGDFCMDEKYRSLGPALQLQRACLEGIEETPFEMCYDFPSRNMMAIYKRLGIQQAETVVRWAKPLRAERKLQSVVRAKRLAQSLGAIANVALAHRGWKGGKSGCELVPQEGVCGEEFNALDRQTRESPGVSTARTAEYLNWRYLANPIVSHEILTARRAGSLIGYAAFLYHGDDAAIVDVSAIEDPSVIASLLAGVADLVRRRGIATLSMCAGDLHPWAPVFARAGFSQRETSPVIVHAPRLGALSGLMPSPRGWRLMQGERDS